MKPYIYIYQHNFWALALENEMLRRLIQQMNRNIQMSRDENAEEEKKE
jgi:hypothetical protein